MPTTLPVPTEEFQPSVGTRLLAQGVMLHLATIAGPVDVFRKKGQRVKAVRLFFNEYGLNLILFALLQLLIFLYVPTSQWWVAEICAVGTLIILSIVQMFVDAVRKPISIYHSSNHEAGISVRVAGEKSWAFFNHYALPVGRKHGVSLRSELHTQARTNRFLLFCYAQNLDVARYYLREHPNGELTVEGSKRPLIVWDYRDEQDKHHSPFQQKTKKIDLFGFDSARNSGSLP